MKLPQITFTRFIAAFLVVAHHYTRSIPFFQTGILGKIVQGGYLAVSYFFFLSGFILIVSVAREENLPQKLEVKKFWINRVIRIYPLYILALLLYWLINAVSPVFKDPFIWSKAMLNIFMLQAWFQNHIMDYNFPGWTLCAELLFYLSFPLLFIPLNKLKNNSIASLIILLWVGSFILLLWMLKQKFAPGLVYFFPLFHLPTFVIGMGTGILFIRNKDKLQSNISIINVVAILLFALFFFLLLINNEFGKYYHNGLLCPLFAFIILTLSLNNGILKKALSSKPLESLGEISYAFYIFQCPVYLLASEINRLYLNFNDLQFFILFLLILLFLSYFFHYMVEQPLRNRLKFKTVGVFKTKEETVKAKTVFNKKGIK